MVANTVDDIGFVASLSNPAGVMSSSEFVTSLKSSTVRIEGPYGDKGPPDLVTERWLLEAFCSAQSQLGMTGPSFGHQVLRLSKEVDLMTCSGQDLDFSVITKVLYPFLWGALPCTPWCHWQRLNLTRGNSKTVEQIMRAREESLRALEVFLRLCRAVEEVHGAIAFE